MKLYILLTNEKFRSCILTIKSTLVYLTIQGGNSKTLLSPGSQTKIKAHNLHKQNTELITDAQRTPAQFLGTCVQTG